MNKRKFRNITRFKYYFHLVSILILFPLTLTISPQQAHAAGGGGGTITGATDPNIGIGSNIVQPTGNTVQPLNQTNPNSNGFSYSQQFSGYGVNNGCGTQFSIGTNYGNSISPYSTNTTNIIGQANTNGYTIGANIVFNSQQCSDPNKQLELQNKQIQSQKDTNCTIERNKFATIVFTANPKITPQELDKMLDVVCE